MKDMLKLAVQTYNKIAKIYSERTYPKIVQFQSKDSTTILNGSLILPPDYQSNKNLLKQLYLLRYAYDKLKKMPELPQYVISLRDDILWTSPLKSENAFAFIEQFPNSYFTSCYYWNGGISERFFISNFDVASLIMNRFKHIDSYFRHMDKLSYVERKGLNAEWLNRYIIEKYGIEVVSQKIITPRVRIGSRVKKDNLLPRPWRLGCYCRAQLSRFRFSIWKFTKWFKIW